MKNTAYLMIVGIMLSFLYACANTNSIARVHPEEVKGLPRCAECHTDQWTALSHQTQDFYLKHKIYAAQQREACNTCHKESFCVRCHAHKEEIKPSDKYKDRPELSLPHRGDYLSRHRVEGRINPASCLKCHGRQNNERCKTCHK
ncbi:cytochrome C [Geomonas propionica]|uniref:Cytochrome C n=1 Tax=Geomonas propionica TaxID=2798582 RepID=A0ABS0YRB9_9BACT|nr:cytochrome C [Geomonas propionica]MBJ6800534.1 cytochrome C [Geomonas propionica]